jgi:hypothetical protein
VIRFVFGQRKWIPHSDWALLGEGSGSQMSGLEEDTQRPCSRPLVFPLLVHNIRPTISSSARLRIREGPKKPSFYPPKDGNFGRLEREKVFAREFALTKGRARVAGCFCSIVRGPPGAKVHL